MCNVSSSAAGVLTQKWKGDERFSSILVVVVFFIIEKPELDVRLVWVFNLWRYNEEMMGKRRVLYISVN